jgi:hypothetical protein
MQKATMEKFGNQFKRITETKPVIKEEEREITVFKHENKQAD